VTWPGPPLSGDQADIVGLVDAIVGKHGAAPQDEDPAEVARARQALADAGLWTLGAAEDVGGGGATLPLLLAFLASVGRHWAALAWASAQAHAALEVLGGDPAWSGLAGRVSDGSAAACVIDRDSARLRLTDAGGRVSGTVARLDPAGVDPHVIVLAGDATAWVLPPQALVFGPVLRRAGLAGALTVAAQVAGATPAVISGVRVAQVRARLQVAGAAIAAGLAADAAERSLGYARSRVQFGAPLTALATVRQAVARQTADAATALAVLHVSGLPAPVDAAAILADNCERAVSVTAAAVQVHGGYGYLAEYGVERLVRDAVSLRAATDAGGSARAAAALLAGYPAGDTDARQARR
jgi:alkylation response protein AidB-like acyl-CoA dehydrogenase